MAKKLYEESSVQAIAAAIREKNGSSATYKLGQMAGAIQAIQPIQPEVVTFNQVNTTAAAYLAAAESAYTDTNGSSVSVVEEYAAYTGTKDAPLGKALTTQAGTRYQQDETSGSGGKVNNLLSGESVLYNAMPGHVLRYIVKNSSGSVVDSGRVKATGALRMMKFVGYMKNFRDLGGWACDGGTVKYGLLYRCAAPGVAEAANTDLARNANIRYHFDLRNEASLAASPFGSGVYYRSYPLSVYYRDLVDLSRSDYAGMVSLLRGVFSAVTHGDGVLYHCSLGRDRTGTLSFLLLALLGVAKKHIDMDYELSDFSSASDYTSAHIVTRKSTPYQNLCAYFQSFGMSTLRDNVVKWALKAGLTLDELNAYRAAAINGTPATLNAADYITRYTLTQQLTDCTSSISLTEIAEDTELSLTISPNSGRKLDSILVTMGGTDISATAVSGNTVSIAAVTGNVVVTASAVAAYTNQIPISTDTDGSTYGWKSGYRLNGSGEAVAQTNIYVTGFIPLTSGDVVRFANMSLGEGTNAISSCRVAFYKADKTRVADVTGLGGAPYWSQLPDVTYTDGVLTSIVVPTTYPDTVAYGRFSCYWMSNSSIITVNEPIT